MSEQSLSHSTHDAQEDLRNRDIKIFLNGRIVPRSEAMVSVYDSGFMLGDGMWEGLRLYDGVWAFFDEHMDRFFNSCKAVSIDVGMTKAEVLQALNDTAKANGMKTDAHCRFMVTRGPKDKPFQHPGLSRSGPTVVAIVEHSKPVDSLMSQGIRLATVPQVRGLPMSQDAKYNSHSKLNCVIACLQAEQAGADEALMLDPHGFVNTTNACNFFHCAPWRGLDIHRRLLHERGDAPKGHRPVPCQRHPCVREELLALRSLWCRRGIPDRYFRRPDTRRVN